LWCREKRDALTEECTKYRDGILSVGQRKIGESMTQGTITHIAYLTSTIEQLNRVIAAYLPPNDQVARR